MSTPSYQIGHLIHKMSSTDKDFRFMATNDLLNELQKDSIKLDDDAEKNIVRTLLNLLKDTNAEVQNLAVKCLGPLINKVKEDQVDIIIETLCVNMLSNEEILKETSSIGLKTVISEISTDSKNLVSAVCKKITGRLINTVKQQNVSVQLETLEIFSDLLFRFGDVMNLYHPIIKDALIPQLNNSRTAVSKRAITCISYMTMTCTDEIYNNIIETLLSELKNCNTLKGKIYINCVTAICKHSGSRMFNYLQTFIQIIVNFIELNDDDLKEACLQALEIFVRRCPQEIAPNIQNVINLTLKFIAYDPNYNYDDDENDDEDMEMDNDIDDDNESDDDYSDDDDMSWKVRRASAKTLEAVILTRLDLLEEFYKIISPVLIGQFKEREENVKVDVFNTYIALLRQTRAIVGNSENSEKFIFILREQVPQIVRSLDRQLKEKSIKTRQSCFALLSELVNILPNALADPNNQEDQKKNYLNNIIPGILYSLNSNNSSSSMKIEALVFLNILFKTHKPQVFQNYFNALITEIKKAVTDSFYKITSEALIVLTNIIPIIRPSLEIECDSVMISYIDIIYSITFAKLKGSEIDHEVRERAITCMGQIICTFGDYLQEQQLYDTFSVFSERLKNEVTRLTCVKSLIKIASVQFKNPISFVPLLPDAFSVLAHFLRQNKRSIKFNTLLLLDTLCNNHTNYFTPEINEIIIKEMLPLISETDLYIAQLCLTTLTSMILSHKAFLAIIPQCILPEALVLVRSPLLQGSTLNAMLDFFRAILKSSFPGLDYHELLARLTQPIFQLNQSQQLHKQAYVSISKCIAAISLLNEKYAFATVVELIDQVKNSNISDSDAEFIQLYSLLTIAEIGKSLNLESLQEKIQEAISKSFNSSNEDVKSAASICLGSVSVGNLERYLPFVLYEISDKENQKRQYLLLNALKEIINCSSVNVNMIQHLEQYISSIWDLLIKHSNCEEEGTRYVVAECLGKLTLIKPDILLPELVKNLDSNFSFVRDTVITAIRFTICESDNKIDTLLKQIMRVFLQRLEDSDINVRRVAFIALNSTAHNKPSLIRDFLDTILPIVYRETKAKQELVREVEMGPFKHTVDDGLDLRKAAFECMYTLLESCLDRIEIFEFLNHVESGLKDTYDIKMLTYLILIRLADLSSSTILQRLDSIVTLLKDTCTSKLKANSVKQEHEKQDELKRSAIRAFLAIYKIRDAEKNAFANELMNLIKTSQDLKPLYETVQNSNKLNSDSYASMDIEMFI